MRGTGGNESFHLNLLDHRADIAVRLGGDGTHLVHTACLLGVPEHRINNLWTIRKRI